MQSTRKCEVEGCGLPHAAKGLCRKHYKRAAYAANPEPVRAAMRAKRDADPGAARAYDNARYAASAEMRERKRGNAARRYAEKRHDEEWREEQNRKQREKDATPEGRAAKADRRKRRHESPENKAKDYAAIRRWNKENPERRRATQRAAQARRNNRQRGVDPAGIQAAIKSGMVDMRCVRCGRLGPCEIDHIIPLSWADVPEVVSVLGQPWAYQPLCRLCNTAKNNYRVECYVPTGDIGLE